MYTNCIFFIFITPMTFTIPSLIIFLSLVFCSLSIECFHEAILKCYCYMFSGQQTGNINELIIK